MMDGKPASLPRVVMVTRPTLLEVMTDRYGTRGQLEFVLRQRGLSWGALDDAHHKQLEAIVQVSGQIQHDQTRVYVHREDLPQFLFRQNDVVVVIGQDGLVANVAKYLNGQRVLGINSDPHNFDGVLCRLRTDCAGAAIRWANGCSVVGRGFSVQSRTMAQAVRDDGLRILALNEIFVGHRTHQSARYLLRYDDKEERQSSSGLICATGSGATGWIRSITQQRQLHEALPQPSAQQLAWFVREPFPSVSTGTSLDHGILLSGQSLKIRSEMGEGGTIFADGIEHDPIEFLGPQQVEIGLAAERLELVVPE